MDAGGLLLILFSVVGSAILVILGYVFGGASVSFYLLMIVGAVVASALLIVGVLLMLAHKVIEVLRATRSETELVDASS